MEKPGGGFPSIVGLFAKDDLYFGKDLWINYVYDQSTLRIGRSLIW